MTLTYRVLVADDHALFREGVVAVLSREPSFEIVGEARDGDEAVRAVGQLNPDLLILDLSMPVMDGIDVIVETRLRWPQVKILVLTMSASEERIAAAIKAGANGYCLKDYGAASLLDAIRDVLKGKSHYCREAMDRIVSSYRTGRSAADSVSPWESLTQRERQVLKLIAEGQRNKSIATIMNISVKTVEKYRTNLMQKLNMHSTALVVAYAVGHGLVQVPTVRSNDALSASSATAAPPVARRYIAEAAQ